jgi:hypothetical protein
VAIGAATLLVLAGAGGALAAGGATSPSTQNTAIIADAASQLSVSSTALSAALVKAIEDQIAAAVTAQTITQKQAAALDARLAAGDVPLFNVFGGRPGQGGPAGKGGSGGPPGGPGGPSGGPGGPPGGGPTHHRRGHHGPGPSGPSGSSGVTGPSGVTTTTTTTTG